MSAAHQSITYNIRKILILLVKFLKITLIKIARNFSRYQIWMTWLINHLRSSCLTRLRLELTWSNLKLNRLPIYLTYRIPKVNNCAHLIFHKNTTYGKLSKTYKYIIYGEDKHFSNNNISILQFLSCCETQNRWVWKINIRYY